MEDTAKLKQRSKSSAKMCKMLESAHKGFDYEVMELQMTLQNPDVRYYTASSVVYGVEVLESSKDKKFDFFRKKLQQLMKIIIIGYQ